MITGINLNKFILLVVPKVANTSIKVSICKQLNIPYQTTEDNGPEVHNLMPTVRADVNSIKRKIGFVRDPWSRTVSTYRNKINPRYHTRVVKKHGITPNTTFKEFVDYISINTYNNLHWTPCSAWYQYAHQVIKMEDINDWWNDNMPIPLEHYNDSGMYDWREYYTPELFDKVKNIYAEDAQYYKELEL